jgi:hypothetical protein
MDYTEEEQAAYEASEAACSADVDRRMIQNGDSLQGAWRRARAWQNTQLLLAMTGWAA